MIKNGELADADEVLNSLGVLGNINLKNFLLNYTENYLPTNILYTNTASYSDNWNFSDYSSNTINNGRIFGGLCYDQYDSSVDTTKWEFTECDLGSGEDTEKVWGRSSKDGTYFSVASKGSNGFNMKTSGDVYFSAKIRINTVNPSGSSVSHSHYIYITDGTNNVQLLNFYNSTGRNISVDGYYYLYGVVNNSTSTLTYYYTYSGTTFSEWNYSPSGSGSVSLSSLSSYYLKATAKVSDNSNSGSCIYFYKVLYSKSDSNLTNLYIELDFNPSTQIKNCNFLPNLLLNNYSDFIYKLTVDNSNWETVNFNKIFYPTNSGDYYKLRIYPNSNFHKLIILRNNLAGSLYNITGE